MSLLELPVELERPTGTVSATFAKTYDACPHSAMLGRKYRAVGQELNRGSVMHDFACSVAARCVASNLTTFPTVDGARLMEHAIADSDDHVDLEQQDTLLLLADTFTATHLFAPDLIVDVEGELSALIAGSVQLHPGEPRADFEVRIVGRIDVLQVDGDTATVTDYKTAYGVEPESKVGGTVQGVTYAVLVLENLPLVNRVKLQWDYVRWGDRGIREVTILREQLPELKRKLALRLGRIVKSRVRDQWPAMPGAHCVICPAQQECPLLLAERRDAPPIDRSMAHAYGDSIVVMKALLKKRNAQVRAWIVEHGPLDIGNDRFELTLDADSFRIDDDAKAAMEAAGIDWRPYAKHVKGSSRFGLKTGGAA